MQPTLNFLATMEIDPCGGSPFLTHPSRMATASICSRSITSLFFAYGPNISLTAMASGDMEGISTENMH